MLDNFFWQNVKICYIINKFCRQMFMIFFNAMVTIFKIIHPKTKLIIKIKLEKCNALMAILFTTRNKNM